MDPKVKILVCCHKQDIVVSQEPYLPIQVGKALHPDLDLGILCDNTGENISSKNGSYCELTGMYWAWKNLKDVDIIGLCHYRRYFDFHGQGKKGLPFTLFSQKQILDLDFSVPESIINKISNGAVVVCSPGLYKTSVADAYSLTHISEDLRTLSSIINDTQSEIIKEAYNRLMYKSNKFSQCNMFLMLKKDYDDYCEWLFDILGKVEEKIDITNYNPVQSRIYGYMAERLMNVWLLANKKDLLAFPVIWINDDFHPMMNYNAFTYLLKKIYFNFTFWLLRLS